MTSPREVELGENPSAVRDTTEEMFPHHTSECMGQFQWDDGDGVYRCMACDETRAYHEHLVS